MREKYKSDFEGVDESGAESAINNFISSLNSVNYETSGCFPMSTNAAYDSTFNTGVDYLKNTDIQSMIDLCNNCINKIITRIKTYKSNYATYEGSYNRYVERYRKYEQDLSDYEKSKEKRDKPIPPSTSTLESMEQDLKKMADQIKNTQF